MTTGLEVRNSSGNVIIDSNTIPSSFYYRYRQAIAPSTSILRSGTYYGIHLNPGNFVDWKLYETMGIDANSDLSVYPLRPVYFYKSDGHSHFVHKDGDLAWVCSPGTIASPLANADDTFSASTYPTRGTKPGATLISTSSKSNSIRSGYLDAYDGKNNINWSVSNYFRHPNIQYTWQGPSLSEFWAMPGTRPPLMKTPYWLKAETVYFTTPITYTSTDGNPLFICLTFLTSYSHSSVTCPHLMWNADGTQLTIQSRICKAGTEDLEFNFNASPRIPVPIASFPSVTKDYFPLE